MKAREWAASLLISPGAAILAIYFVLPAAQGCGETVYYPYEFHEFYFPYFFGVFCVIAGIKLARNRVTERFALLFPLITGAGGVAWGWWIHAKLAGSSGPEDTLISLFLLFTWWLGAIFLVQIKHLTSSEKKVSRAVWAGSIWCIALFTVFITGQPLYGLKLSFASALALLAGGLLAEFVPRHDEGR
jgi:nitrate reductase gamma subunit